MKKLLVTLLVLIAICVGVILPKQAVKATTTTDNLSPMIASNVTPGTDYEGVYYWADLLAEDGSRYSEVSSYAIVSLHASYASADKWNNASVYQPTFDLSAYADKIISSATLKLDITTNIHEFTADAFWFLCALEGDPASPPNIAYADIHQFHAQYPIISNRSYSTLAIGVNSLPLNEYGVGRLNAHTGSTFTFAVVDSYYGQVTATPTWEAGADIEVSIVKDAYEGHPAPILQITYLTNVPPSVETGNTFTSDSSGAIVNGDVTSIGSNNVTEWGTCYGLTTDCSNNVTNSGNEHYSFSWQDTLWPLASDTTYYYKSFALNAIGLTYGEVKSFKTTVYIVPPSYPSATLTIKTMPATSITSTSFVANGQIVSGVATTRGFQYGLTQYAYTDNLSDTGSFDVGNYAFFSDFTTHPNATIYYRAFASNAVDTSYGTQAWVTLGTSSQGGGDGGTTISISSLIDSIAIGQGITDKNMGRWAVLVELLLITSLLFVFLIVKRDDARTIIAVIWLMVSVAEFGMFIFTGLLDILPILLLAAGAVLLLFVLAGKVFVGGR